MRTAFCLVLLALAGCGETAPIVRHRHAGAALTALDQLPVKGRAPKTGYDRGRFGGEWARVRGCDTRDRILARDLDDVVYDRGSRCEIASGRLSDPYTATHVAFVRGAGSEVDIDHVVAEGDAWQKGAQQWTFRKRVQFANDPLNLLAVDASANRQKGDGDAATWLPPNKAYRCSYVARQIAVKRRYGAWVTSAEKDAMRRVLSRCPKQQLPVASPRLTIGGAGPQFETCAAARAAGRAPLVRGDGVYEKNIQLDRDGDGVACE
jgi:hypothetical protein